MEGQQVQVGNKFALLGVEEEVAVGDSEVQESIGGQETVQNKLLAVIDEVQEVIQLDKVSPVKGGNQGKCHSPKNNNTGSGKMLNPSAPKFNPMANGQQLATVGVRINETTADWVQRTFGGNVADINTSCQDIPYQDTRVEGELAKT